MDDAHHTLSGRRSMAKRQGGKEGPENENKSVCPRGRCALQERVLGAHVKVCGSLTGQLCHQRNTYGRPTMSSEKYIWDPVECTSKRERANKSLVEGIKASLGRDRARWVDELPNVLWAHRTSLKQSNGETPFSLTYGSEAVIPTEIGMPTYRTMMIREDENEDELRLNMDLHQGRRETAAIREVKYKTKMEQYSNQKVRLMSFNPDEYVF
ncbi:reverse transcriptase domain-containing protein [Tanacetum coccineum]